MKKFQLGSVTSPSIEMEVGGQVVKSKVIKNTQKNPNFDDPLLFFDIVSCRRFDNSFCFLEAEIRVFYKCLIDYEVIHQVKMCTVNFCKQIQ